MGRVVQAYFGQGLPAFSGGVGAVGGGFLVLGGDFGKGI